MILKKYNKPQVAIIKFDLDEILRVGLSSRAIDPGDGPKPIEPDESGGIDIDSKEHNVDWEFWDQDEKL